MRILSMQNIRGIGGSEMYLLELLPALQAKGITTEFINVFKKADTAEAQDFSQRLRDKGISVHEIPTNTFASPAILLRINRIYRHGNFDAIHTHLIYSDLWAALTRRFLNRKMIVFSTKHGYSDQGFQDNKYEPESVPKSAYYRVIKFAERSITKSYACSESLKDFFERAKLVKKDTLEVIHHGFNYPSALDLDEGYRMGHPQLVIVGRLIVRKGHLFVLTILPELVKSYPDLKLVIVGSGEAEDTFRQMVIDTGMEEHVVFTGFKRNILDYIASSDIAIVPSIAESFGLVILEGFACKKPVIAFDTAGPSDVITHHKTGYLVPRFDTEALKNCIIEVLENPVEAAKIGQLGYESLHNYFNLDRMVSETISFYQRHLKRH